MDALHRDKALFTAIAFGDFNNRLVCTSDQKAAVKLRKNEAGGKPVLVLAPSGVEELVKQLSDPQQRRHLFLTRGRAPAATPQKCPLGDMNRVCTRWFIGRPSLSTVGSGPEWTLLGPRCGVCAVCIGALMFSCPARFF